MQFHRKSVVCMARRLLDKFDGQRGLLQILTDENIIGRQCSDGEITPEAVQETIRTLLNADFPVIDDDLPWDGDCRNDGEVVPCREIADNRQAVINNCLEKEREEWVWR